MLVALPAARWISTCKSRAIADWAGPLIFLLLPALILNELAVVLFAPSAALAYILSFQCITPSFIARRVSNNPKPFSLWRVYKGDSGLSWMGLILICTSVFVQAAFLPLLAVVQLLCFALPLVVTIWTTWSEDHGDAWVFILANLSEIFSERIDVVTIQAIWLLAGTAQLQLLVRLARRSLPVFRPLFFIILTFRSLYDSMQGKGALWKGYVLALTGGVRFAYRIRMSGGGGLISRAAGELLLAIVWLTWWSWPSIIPILTGEYLWLLLTILPSLLFLYRSIAIIKMTWSSDGVD